MGTDSILVNDVLWPAFDELLPGRTVRAVSFAELTDNKPVLVLAPSLATACSGAGGLLAASFASCGAHVMLSPAAGAAEPDGLQSFGSEAMSQQQPCQGRRAARKATDLAALQALGSPDPDTSLSILDTGPHRAAEVSLPIIVDRLADALTSSGAATLFVPHMGTGGPDEATIVAATRRLHARNRHLRLWRFAVPSQRIGRSRAATDETRGLRLLDINRWKEAKCTALRHCESQPNEGDCTRTNAFDIPAERFWQASTSLLRRG